MAKRAKDIQRNLDLAELKREEKKVQEKKEDDHNQTHEKTKYHTYTKVMNMVAKEVEKQYQENLERMEYGEPGGIMASALKWIFDYRTLTISFVLSTGNAHYDMVLKGMEYGTGIYGPNKRPITPKHSRFLKFPAYEANIAGKARGEELPGQRTFIKNGYVYTTATRGVKPGFMMTKAMKSVIHQYGTILDGLGITLEVIKGHTALNMTSIEHLLKRQKND